MFDALALPFCPLAGRRGGKHKLPHFQVRITRILSHTRVPKRVQGRVTVVRFEQGRIKSSFRGRFGPTSLFPSDGDDKLYQLNSLAHSQLKARERACSASSCPCERCDALLPLTGLESERAQRNTAVWCPRLAGLCKPTAGIFFRMRKL